MSQNRYAAGVQQRSEPLSSFKECPTSPRATQQKMKWRMMT
ncbi:hypothetical protein LX76_01871 [Cereibacter changlensis]|uniref:Uncharacterized protein n=1 Tax=Cereibacter changlensis TaxID=402884 RepID=A0A2W7R086_9RHOB|nr:hypothetical protein LX76_01871 [Cereibacter changlensis]